jgi:hypothetical protein
VLDSDGDNADVLPFFLLHTSRIWVRDAREATRAMAMVDISDKMAACVGAGAALVSSPSRHRFPHVVLLYFRLHIF